MTSLLCTVYPIQQCVMEGGGCKGVISTQLEQSRSIEEGARADKVTYAAATNLCKGLPDFYHNEKIQKIEAFLLRALKKIIISVLHC